MSDKMTLTEIAACINKHLKRLERITPPQVFSGKDGQEQKNALFFHAGACRAGSRVSIVYVCYQGHNSLTKEEALKYLAYLEAGNTGRHWEMLKKPDAGQKAELEELMMDQQKLAKLPRWAQDELQRLQRTNVALKARIEQFSGEAATKVHYCMGTDKIPLPDGWPIRFTLGEVYDAHVSVRIMEGGTTLQLMGGASLSVRPMTTNMVEVRMFRSDEEYLAHLSAGNELETK